MKPSTFLSLLVLVALSVTSCGKRVCCVAPLPGNGQQLSAKKGSVAWSTYTPQASYVNDSLYITGQVKGESVTFRIKFNGEGKYKLTGNEATLKEVAEGNVTVMEYRADDTAESFIEVLHYTAESRQIYGTFKLNLFRDHLYDTYDSGMYPQKLAFTNGEIRIILPK